MQTVIRIAHPGDLSFLTAHDHHIARSELESSIRQGRILLAECGSEIIGWLRWGMFWDNTPFMNLLYLLEEHRQQGHGRALVHHWEESLRQAGHTLAMTSTQANEDAQLFYRRLGYRDVGGFMLPGEPYELILIKEL